MAEDTNSPAVPPSPDDLPDLAAPPEDSGPNSPPEAPERGPSRAPRIYAALVSGSLILAALYILLQSFWGEGDAQSWSFFLAALVCGLGTLGGAAVLTRTARRQTSPQDPPGFLAWLCFPMMFLCLIALLPLLVLAISPSARTWLTPRDAFGVEHVKSPREIIRVVFPRPVMIPEEGLPPLNLMVNDQRIPTGVQETHPGAITWSDHLETGDARRLTLELALLRKALPELGEVTSVRVNAVIGDVPQIVDASGKRFTQQTLAIP